MGYRNRQELPKEVLKHYERFVTRLNGLNIRDWTAVFTMGMRPYLFIDILGTGSYSTVYKAIVVNQRKVFFPEQFAIKVLKNMKYKDAIKREIMTADRLMNNGHQNIIEFKEWFRWGTISYLVMELAPIGDLFEVLQKMNHLGQKVWRPLRPQYCRHFIKGIALGVQHLFSMGISHGDIKLENVLVNWYEPMPNTPQDFTISRFMRMVPKLTDFNNSKIGEPEMPLVSNQPRCSPVTAAPESLFMKSYYDMKIADVYSVGACLLAMLLACYPFIPANDTPENELFIRCTLLKKDINLINQLIKPFDDSLKQVLLRTLEPDPQNRITIDEFLDEEWVTQSN